MKVSYYLLLLFVFILRPIYSQITPEIVNYHIYDGPGEGIDMVNDMTMDILNQFYLSGRSVGTDGSPDLTVIKYSNSLDSIIVMRYVSAPYSWDEANSIVIDPANNIYVTGNGGFGQSYQVMAIVKYSDSGNLMWERNFNSTTNISSNGVNVILDSNNNPIIGGMSEGDVFLYKYSPDGDSLWSIIISDDICDYELNELIIDDEDNYYLAMIQYIWQGGEFPETNVIIAKYDSVGVISWKKSISVIPGEISTKTLLDHNNNLILLLKSEVRILKYDQSGILQWDNNYQTSAFYLSNICIDSDNNILVAGDGPGIGISDYIIKKISSSGNDIWFQQFNGNENIRDHASSVCVDDSNNVFVTGLTHDMINTGTCYTIRYSTDGDQDWVIKFDAPHSTFEDPIKIMLDDSNNIFVGGDAADSTNGWNFFLCKIRQKIGTNIFINNGEISQIFYLDQCYPNPFNANTKIKFRIPYDQEVSLEFFNILGIKVKDLIHRHLSAGEYTIDFNATNLPSGIYYYRFISDDFQDCKKAIFIR